MSSRDRDEILSKFIGITQCPGDQAREYLEAAEWNEQVAMDFFFDSGGAQASGPTPSPTTRPHVPNPTGQVPGRTGFDKTVDYESDDDLLQHALEESLHVKQPEKSPVTAPTRTNINKSIVSSKVNTINSFQKDGDSSEEEGQAFYAGGSERSGQQIIGPPKAKDNDKKVTNLFEAARKMGATEANDDDRGSSSRTKEEKPFAGTGYTLGDENRPSRSQGQSSGSTAAASNKAEELPIRLYSNGFTVGDGELRKFEDNKEFMEHLKRGDVPPELRNSDPNKQVQVRLEDHRGEEYKHVAPAFKPFGGSGHTVGLPASNNPRGQAPSRSSNVSSASSTSAPIDADRLEQLAEKRLKTSSSSTTIRLRLPDFPTPISIRIDLNRTLGDVRKFLNENVPSLQSNTFEFLEPPATKIKREDERRKISDAKLSNSTLAVRRTA